MEASALSHASQRGLLARRSPLLRLQGDARLIALARGGDSGAFETIVDRYQGRLLGFCRQMLGSTEDAEDVLQEVFVNAYRAMLADEREINLRPWLYRIARNRCLNHLRKPTADAQESMDMVPAVEAASTAEKVGNREEFRQLLADVGKLPETQRTALLLREMDAMSYEEIAAAMDTSVPSVKSLLVRARISLAEASQARQLTCGEVRLELAEAAEGIRKASGPVRRHLRECEECADFRAQIRSNDRALAAIFPAGPLLALKAFLVSKLGFGAGAGSGAGGGAAAASAAGSGAAGAGAAGAGAAGVAGAGAAGAGAAATAAAGTAAALGGGSAASGIGAVGGAIGTKAVAGVVTAAALAAGAVGITDRVAAPAGQQAKVSTAVKQRRAVPTVQQSAAPPVAAPSQATEQVAPPPTEPAPAPVEPAPAPHPVGSDADAAGPSTTAEETEEAKSPKPAVTAAKQPDGSAGAPSGSETVVVTVGSAPAEEPPPAEASPPAESPPPPAPPPSESAPPTESSPPPPPPSGSEADAGEEPAAPAGS